MAALPWVKLDDGFDDHEKVVELLGDAGERDLSGLSLEELRELASQLLGLGAIGLHTLALTYSGRRLTDGTVSKQLPRRFGAPPIAVDLLVEHDLWEQRAGGWQIHDYLDYNPSKEKVEAEREAAKTRMKKVRDSRRSSEQRPNFGGSSSSPEPEPVPEPTRDKPPGPTSAPAAADGGSAALPDRPELARLCTMLADAVEAQGVGRRPNEHTKRWHDAARLLLDLDGATVRQVEYVIAWATSDSFWRANIRSMPKLREKWPTLVLRIKEQDERGRTGGTARDRAGADMAALQRLADEQRARGE